MAVFIALAWFCFDIASKLEIFSYLFLTEILSNDTREEYIIDSLNYFFKIGAYYQFTDGIFLATAFFFLGLHFLFSPYPRPVRFNQKNGLVYTKFMGKIWVANWNMAAVKIWRGKNVFLPGSKPFRGIQIRMHSLDRKGKVKERWVLLSAVNSNKINDLDIGGDPSLLYWHWLDEYMRGASFEGEPPSGSRNKCIPKPKIGRLPALEAIMRFRDYKFAPSIDIKAVELDKQLKGKRLYPMFKADELPENPYFTWEIDFPEREMPNSEGVYIDDNNERDKP